MSRMNLDDPFAMETPSPPSSPPSSPAFPTADSSPPSSPNIASIDTYHSSPGVSHPFAASTKATRAPKIYEKQSLGWNRTSSRSDGTVEGAHDQSQASDTHDSRISRVCERTGMRKGEILTSNRSLFSQTSSQVLDPLAASAKTQHTPWRRQKEFTRVRSDVSTASWLSLDSDGVSTVIDTMDEVDLVDMEEDAPQGSRQSGATREEREGQRWDEAISRAIDRADGVIHLNRSSLLTAPLTFIPPSVINDLVNLVLLSSEPRRPRGFRSSVRISGRTVSTPTLPRPFLSHGDKFIAKSASYTMWITPPPPPSNEMQLLLAGNEFRSLPVELFRLTGLTVLSLRSNLLTSIPPQISHLTHLRELNVSSNKLRYLPAEMLDMQLEDLVLSNNPWISPEAEAKAAAQCFERTRYAHREQRDKPVVVPPSLKTAHFSIPPLSELCLRVLLRPAAPQVQATLQTVTKRAETVLEALYKLPLTDLPPNIMQLLGSCLPNVVAQPMTSASASPVKRPRVYSSQDVHLGHITAPASDVSAVTSGEETPPGISVCPSPLHRTPQGTWVDGRVPVFVHHAEERFTWERLVAGVEVGAQGEYAGVPVRWRGCGRECLGFLDERIPEPVISDSEQEDSDNDESSNELQWVREFDVGSRRLSFGEDE